MPTAHSLLKSKLVVTGIEIITITLQYIMFKNLGNYRAYRNASKIVFITIIIILLIPQVV